MLLPFYSFGHGWQFFGFGSLDHWTLEYFGIGVLDNLSIGILELEYWIIGVLEYWNWSIGLLELLAD